jgi:hypothetical protein
LVFFLSCFMKSPYRWWIVVSDWDVIRYVEHRDPFYESTFRPTGVRRHLQARH